MRGTLTVVDARACPTTVHPRVCGEHAAIVHRSVDRTPVHPRVCGEHASHVDVRHADQRFIPACAGNTSASISLSCNLAVHPRVCGEHSTADRRSADEPRGSSPRVRGTHRSSASPDSPCRFIPACAGNTPCIRPCRMPMTVHPRVCGEHDRRSARSIAYRRFIPACAGNTVPACSRCRSCTVHPRVCGEHASVSRYRDCAIAVHPRVCGEHTRWHRSTWLSPVHPRVCGEHLASHAWHPCQHGSSPRVRGTQPSRRGTHSHDRFIPACAGNTPSASA